MIFKSDVTKSMAHQKLKYNILISAFLLAFLLRQPHFYFGFFEIVGLAIGRAKLRDREIAISFSRYFLKKVLINFEKCMITANSS